MHLHEPRTIDSVSPRKRILCKGILTTPRINGMKLCRSLHHHVRIPNNSTLLTKIVNPNLPRLLARALDLGASGSSPGEIRESIGVDAARRRCRGWAAGLGMRAGRIWAVYTTCLAVAPAAYVEPPEPSANFPWAAASYKPFGC